MAEDDREQRGVWFRREILPLEPQLRAYVRRISFGRFDTEDIVQEALARVITTENWRAITDPAPYLRVVTRHLVTDMLRREKIVAIDAVSDLVLAEFRDESPSPEAAAAARDILRRLAAIVAKMPMQCRRVFTLRKIYDLSMQEIGDRLGLSVSTVEKHLAKGVRLCDEQWELQSPSPQETSGHGSIQEAAQRPDRRPGGSLGRASGGPRLR